MREVYEVELIHALETRVGLIQIVGNFNDNFFISGGPLQIALPDIKCMYHIVGLTSHGAACGVANVPGIYSKVYPYLDWIESVGVWTN